jgi:phosphoenolpyruvate---glycerone phosphotransferase subunit DhaL
LKKKDARASGDRKTMTEQSSRQLIAMFEAIGRLMDSERDYLSELDGAIGDGDHGFTMALGFNAVNSSLSRLDPSAVHPSEIMALAAKAFLSAVGASTGPLYSAAFSQAATVLADGTILDAGTTAQLLRALAVGIAHRGKGQRGDKTMLDVWFPAADAALAAAGSQKTTRAFWTEVMAAAESGANATRSMIAIKGRAAKLGERSLGHVDPGAASALMMISAMSMTLATGHEGAP